MSLVIHGFCVNNICLFVKVFIGAISSKRLVTLVKNVEQLWFVSIDGSMIWFQSIRLNSSWNSRLLKTRQLRDDFLGHFLFKFSRISSWANCNKWSDIEVVRLPPMERQLRSLIKMLSMRVAELDENLVGWSIRGLNPNDESWS